MRDDPPPPGDDSHDALEQELRALFVPVAAPRAFRRQLKSELLRDQRSRIALPPTTGTDTKPWSLRRVTTRRGMAILVSGAVAIAAAVLLTAAVRGFNTFTMHEAGPTYVTPTPSVTHTPIPTRVVVVAPAPTATSSPAPTSQPTHLSTQANEPKRIPTPTAGSSHHRASWVRPAHQGHTHAVVPASLPTRRPTRMPSPTIPSRPAAVTTQVPAVATTTAVPPPPTATITVPPAPPPTPSASPTATATPSPSQQPSATATRAAPTRMPLALPARTPTTIQASPTPPHRPEARPTKTQTQAVPRVTIPRLGITIPLPPAPPSATAAQPTVAPSPSITAAQPTVAPSPSITPLPTATATVQPRVTATATPSPSASPTAIPSPSATPQRAPAIPLDQPAPAVPNASNGLLGSPLNGAAAYAQQPLSYTVASTLTLAMAPLLPVYPLTATHPSLVDALTVARSLGATSIQSGPAVQPDDSIVTALQVGATPYTLTVFDGYGTPRFTLHARTASVGHASALQVAGWAAAWLRTHGLDHPDLRLVDVTGDTASFGQAIGGMPLCGSAAIQIGFDGQGVVHDLSYAYVRPAVAVSWALQPPAIAAAAAIDQGQGLYRGPGADTVAGPAAINTITVAYVGVRGSQDYLEPVYVLTGVVPTASGPQPFSLYVPALQYATVATPTP